MMMYEVVTPDRKSKGFFLNKEDAQTVLQEVDADWSKAYFATRALAKQIKALVDEFEASDLVIKEVPVVLPDEWFDYDGEVRRGFIPKGRIVEHELATRVES